MKYIKIILLFIIIVILLLVGAIAFVSHYYKDEITNQIVNELNKQIKTEINVEKINFSVFENFPEASLLFFNIVAKSTTEFNKNDFSVNTDTLFYAETFALRFNIIDIYKKKYQLKSVSLENGIINIFKDAKGKDNYHFLKKSNKDSAKVKIDIKNIKLINIYCKIINKQKHIYTKTFTKKVRLHGEIVNDKYNVNSKGELIFIDFKYKNNNYLSGNFLNLKHDINITNNKIIINKSQLISDEIDFNISGNISTDEFFVPSLTIKAYNQNIFSLFELLPENYEDLKNEILVEGKCNITTFINGNENNKIPDVETIFSFDKTDILFAKSDIKFHNVNCSGKLYNINNSNKTISTLNIDTISGNLGESSIGGSGIIENFKSANINFEAKADIILSDLMKQIKKDTLITTSGKIFTDFALSGQIKDLKNIVLTDILKLIKSGSFNFDDINYEHADSLLNFSKINGQANYFDNKIRLDSISLNVLDNELLVNGIVVDFIKYLCEDSIKFNVKSNIYSQKLDLNQFLKTISQEESKESKNNNIFPQFVDFNINIKTDKLIINKFKATNVKGIINYSDNALIFSPFELFSMDGKIEGSGIINKNNDGTYNSTIKGNLYKLDINKLFYSFNNFKQDFISNENLNGLVTAEINFSSSWTKNLDIILDNLIVESAVKIIDGELVNFEPIENLSKFIELSELKHITFSTIQNDILINNKTIYISQMDINSSAFNISLSGTHSFNNEISYKIKVLLSEVLSKKAKKNKKENIEFGVIEDDNVGKTSLFLSIDGTVDDYKIRYDTKQVRNKIKNDLKDEKNEIKTILHEEFGWFKKDSILLKKKEEEKDNKFIIEWDEDDDN